MAISNERLSRLIGLIYDAAISPERWDEVLRAIRSELNAEIASINLQSLTDGQVLLNMTSNIPDPYSQVMGNYGLDVLDIWGGPAEMMSLPLDRPAILSRLQPTALDFAVTQNRYALEWAKPQGLIDSLAIGLARDEGMMGSVSFGRHADIGAFDDAAVELATLLVPHLQRAATINRLLEMEDVLRTSFATAFDLLTIPVFLVSGDMQLRYSNASARALLADKDVFRDHKGTLDATNGSVGHAVAAAVRQSADEAGLGAQGLGIPATRRDGSPAALYVLPLSARPGWQPDLAVAAVFVASAGTRYAVPDDLVGRLFGLTPAEARVCALLVQGLSAQDIAEALDVADTTVKTHIRRIYDKTGVRRQPELVHLVTAFAAPIG